MTNWTRGLNQEQQQAVLHSNGPLLILAGAGSGKTTVLVSRTGQLIEHHNIAAEKICVLTFTNKASRELKERVDLKLGLQNLWSGTFHSFGLQLLRRFAKVAGLPSNFGVIDQSDSQAIIKDLLLDIKNYSKDSFKTEKLISMINEKRQGLTTSIEVDEYEEMAVVLLPKYLKRLEMLGVLDFEALLIEPLKLFEKHPKVLDQLQDQFSHLMVDEFQDTNALQFRLVKALSARENNLAVVGDDDQSIYGWRGACVSNILDFPKHFKDCKVVRLERNYRSTPAILSVANAVIGKNENRYGKILKCDPQALDGDKPELFVYETDDIETEEVTTHIQHYLTQGFSLKDMAVLYRSNGQGGMIEAGLRKAQIAYSITGGTGLFDRRESKDILAYLRCSVSPNEIAFRRILNVPARGIGEATIERINVFAETHGIKFHIAARGWKKAGVGEKIGGQIDQLFLTLDHMAAEILSGPEVGQLLAKQMIKIGYRNHLQLQSKQKGSLEKKWAIVEIVGRILETYVERGQRDEATLLKFLDAMELRDLDLKENKEDRVQLLTLHACKGLEFPVVIFVGCEEDLIPHRILGSDVSEERRLFYVGLTRAKKHLVLTRAQTRKRFGKWQPCAPSRFLLEIPSEMLTAYASGFRPLPEVNRKQMLADLFAKIDRKAQL